MPDRIAYTFASNAYDATLNDAQPLGACHIAISWETIAENGSLKYMFPYDNDLQLKPRPLGFIQRALTHELGHWMGLGFHVLEDFPIGSTLFGPLDGLPFYGVDNTSRLSTRQEEFYNDIWRTDWWGTPNIDETLFRGTNLLCMTKEEADYLMAPGVNYSNFAEGIPGSRSYRHATDQKLLGGLTINDATGLKISVDEVVHSLPYRTSLREKVKIQREANDIFPGD